MWKLKYKGKNRGFTLTELIVTISIIAVLGGIGSVVIGKMMATNRQTTCIANLRSISQAMQLHYNDLKVFPNDGYPDDANDPLPLSTELAGYIKDKSTFVCPEDKDNTSISDFASYDPYYVSRQQTYGEHELAIGCPRHRGAVSSTGLFSTGSTEIMKISSVLAKGQEISPDGTTAQRTISSVDDIMLFDDGSSVTIKENTGGTYGCFLVQSARLADGALYSIIKVQNNGKIDVSVSPGSKFEIVTPSAIVGVRGTVFTVTTTDSGFTTSVVLTEGTVVLMDRPTGGTTTLTEGGTTEGTVEVLTHDHMHYHVDGTYHGHEHPSLNNAHHGDPLAAKKAAAASTTANEDNDGDGYSENQGDCDDANAAVYPGATDIPENGIDEDCDGQDAVDPDSTDDDGDGYTENEGDCDDANSAVYPGATDTPGNGIDEDCDGQDAVDPDDVDDDDDGYSENEGDCDDTVFAINPDATEVFNNGIDDDCDPYTFDSSFEEMLIYMIADPEVSSSDLRSSILGYSPTTDNVLNAAITRDPQMQGDHLLAVLDAQDPLSDSVLITVINTDSLLNSNKYKLIHEHNSPLSESVLNASINNTSIMTSTDFKSILVLNSPLPSSIINQVTEGIPPLDSGDYDDVIEAQ